MTSLAQSGLLKLCGSCMQLMMAVWIPSAILSHSGANTSFLKVIFTWKGMPLLKYFLGYYPRTYKWTYIICIHRYPRTIVQLLHTIANWEKEKQLSIIAGSFLTPHCLQQLNKLESWRGNVFIPLIPSSRYVKHQFCLASKETKLCYLIWGKSKPVHCLFKTKSCTTYLLLNCLL